MLQYGYSPQLAAVQSWKQVALDLGMTYLINILPKIEYCDSK
jgi:hypothetical protein